jgi:hypothetical protein
MSEKTIVIHVRFAPDGSVAEIGERPAGLSAQQWYSYLSEQAGAMFQTLAGGRGVFRLGREQVDALKENAALQ